MKILVIGGGGREHAICWKLACSPLAGKIYCAPGNAGIAGTAECVGIGAGSVEELLKFSKKEKIDLTVVGPELPLTMGIVDMFRSEGLLIVGPCGEAARLEGSKLFAKEIMDAAGVPTAGWKAFTDADEAVRHIRRMDGQCVVKADGLAAGKGVFVCSSKDEAIDAVKSIMRDRLFGEAGERIVVEEMLTGEEVSFIALTDGSSMIPLASSQDHKRAFDNDSGPNTGGMGAYSPAPFVDEEMKKKIMATVMRPVVSEMKKRGIIFSGFLYAGLMISKGKPYVLEFNVRLGDPETQPLMFRLKTDLVPLLVETARGRLVERELEWDPRPAVCVVMASGGYPGEYSKGMEIQGLAEAGLLSGTHVFHAGTSCKNGKIVTSGGRVLGVTSLGDDFQGAINNAYEAVSKIKFEGCHFRRDIAARVNIPRKV